MLFFKRKKNEVESDSSSSLPDGEESVGVTNKNKQAQPGIDNQSIFRGFVLNGSLAQFNPGTVNTSSLGSQFAVPLSWHNLSYTVNGRKVLRGLTGTALPSRCLAIMGSSGAGKTTFLNAVCDRLATSSTIKLQGTRQLGDVEYRHQHCKAMGFVAQDDILAPLETPEGALSFSLRVRRGTTKKETMERVEETLQELRLVHCRSTIVGIPGLQAGLSGGERKRCSIGVELICDPKILLLDEPTSGLDSVTSAKIVHLLNTLARTGRTVVYTIHQPTSEMLNYFDDIMLLTQGRCVYHGTMENSLGYFESIGYRCPETFTPTDFYMTLLQDPDISKILIKKWKSYLKSSTRTPHSTAVDLNPNPENSSTTTFLKKYSEHFGSTPWIQFTELARRNTVELSRNYMFIFSNFVQAAFFGLVIGLIFLNVGPDIYGVQDRQGVLFMTTMNRAMGQTFIMINGFMAAKPLYIREQRVGAYSPPIYFLAKLLVGLPLRLVFALLECCIIYWMVGFYNDAGAFFYFFSVVVMITEVASALGFAFSSWFGSLVVASGLAPVVLLPLALAGGLLASTDRLRPYWYWLEKPSMVRHSYILLSRNEFKRLDNIYCDSAVNGEEFCKYQPKNGMEVLQLLGFEEPQSADWVMWMSLGLLFLIFNTLANIALCITARKKF